MLHRELCRLASIHMLTSGRTMYRYLRFSFSMNGESYRCVEMPTPSVMVGSGRAADLRIPDPSLANKHLRLFRDGGAVRVIAMAPGVRIDGDELRVDEERSCVGTTISIGPARFVAEPWDSDEDLGEESAEYMTREVLRELFGDAPVGKLRSPPN